MEIKTVAKKLGNGLLDGLSAIHDASVRNQIEELDKEADALRKQLVTIQEKKDQLESELR